MSWEGSAEAWIAEQGETGDWARRWILFPIFREVLSARPGTRALDVGCGEGQLCRLARDLGVGITGLDPTRALLGTARARDPGGAYVEGRAEALPFPDAAFDLVLSCVALVDIADVGRAIPEMARVLRPGGRALVANTHSLFSAGQPRGWIRDMAGRPLHYPVDDYLEPRSFRAEWRGIAIDNHHRPLAAYMAAFLGAGLILRRFEEPAARSDDPGKDARHDRMPYFVVMEWEKP